MAFKYNNQDFENICRICLKPRKKLISLFTHSIAEMLNFCEFWRVKKFDSFPQNICNTCKDLVLKSYKLKQLCISSKFSLENLMKTDEEFISVGDARMLYITKNGDICISDDETDINKCDSSNIKDQINDSLYQAGNTIIDVEIEEHKCESTKYSCDKCHQNFDYEKDAMLHQSIHSVNLTCNACKKIFITKKKLQRHIKTHMVTKSHKCKICDKGFCELAALNKHIKLQHLGVPRNKNYCCKDCGKRFTDKYYLSLHTRKHTGEKPLRCNICDKSFYDPRSLKVHIMAHKGNKSYLCSYCGKSFVQSAHLKKHLVVHTNEKLFNCDICHKKFTQSSSLKRHKKLHLDKMK